MSIKEKIAEKLPAWRERTNKLIKEHGKFKIADVTVDQIFGGIRGVPIEVSDISYVDPYEGLRLRGYTVPEVLTLLPKPRNCEYPLLGGLYFLLMTGDLPTQEEAERRRVGVRDPLRVGSEQALRVVADAGEPVEPSVLPQKAETNGAVLVRHRFAELFGCADREPVDPPRLLAEVARHFEAQMPGRGRKEHEAHHVRASIQRDVERLARGQAANLDEQGHGSFGPQKPEI